MKVIGFAAGRIASDLRSKGGHLAASPEGFFVKDKEGPLNEGELERAAAGPSRFAGVEPNRESRVEMPTTRRFMLAAVKVVHSLIFLGLQSTIAYLLVTGVKGRTDRRTAVAAAVVGAEAVIYVGNGFRCPLTGLAENLGAERGSVTDIFLPRWLAANIDRIYGPLFALALVLHLLNLRRRGKSRRRTAGYFASIFGA